MVNILFCDFCGNQITFKNLLCKCSASQVHVWRHPQPQFVNGRCIGRTDVVVDPRKARRLAHQIRTWARLYGLPRVVITSHLQRGHAVGRWLARWGWAHRVDARLAEFDFGAWDGQLWAHIHVDAIDAWCADFAQHRPGGGESVALLLERCAAFLAQATPGSLIVGHAGWISAAVWRQAGFEVAPNAATWPRAVAYGERTCLPSTKKSPPE
jgi:alpha-ribazole phosphatase